VGAQDLGEASSEACSIKGAGAEDCHLEQDTSQGSHFQLPSLMSLKSRRVSETTHPSGVNDLSLAPLRGLTCYSREFSQEARWL
jgi:hypothetical protein